MSREGSPIRYDVGMESVRVAARDGVALATDVHFPAIGGARVEGRFPVVVERTPYSRRRTFLHASARYFARRGYVAVMQDVRGRGDSEGTWEFLGAVEGTDGHDTLAWIRAQPWCEGRVGTMGLSYSASDQQSLALTHPPGLAAQVLMDGGYSYFHRTLRQGGACELGVLLPYVYRTAREGKELGADPRARAAFDAAWADMPRWLPRLSLGEGELPLGHAPAYEEWFLRILRGGDYGEQWKHEGINLLEHVDRYPDVPILLESSWYGHHVWATTEKFRAFRSRFESPVRMILGTWLHGYEEFGRTWAGEVDFGPDSVLDGVDDLRLAFFDRWLKGLPTGFDEGPPVRLFVMGGGDGRRDTQGRLRHGGRWRDESDWPPPRMQPTRWFLHPEGVLAPDPPPDGAEPDAFTFDPRDPVPTVGSSTQSSLLPGLLLAGGYDQRGRGDLWVCRDRRPLAARDDVLVFQTPPLERDVELTGPIEVVLWVASSAVDTDFTVKLVDVYPSSPDDPGGFALNLTDGILRMRYRDGFERGVPMTPGEVYRIAIAPQATSNLFRAGHRIRLDVSSSNFPHFDVNPNTGEPLGRHRSVEVAHNRVFHDAARPSHVVLPVVPID